MYCINFKETCWFGRQLFSETAQQEAVFWQTVLSVAVYQFLLATSYVCSPTINETNHCCCCCYNCYSQLLFNWSIFRNNFYNYKIKQLTQHVEYGTSDIQHKHMHVPQILIIF